VVRGRGWLYLSVALRMIINYRYILEKRLGGTHCQSGYSDRIKESLYPAGSQSTFRRSYSPKFRDVEFCGCSASRHALSG